MHTLLQGDDGANEPAGELPVLPVLEAFYPPELMLTSLAECF
jgi:hypothetical protein